MKGDGGQAFVNNTVLGNQGPFPLARDHTHTSARQSSPALTTHANISPNHTPRTPPPRVYTDLHSVVIHCFIMYEGLTGVNVHPPARLAIVAAPPKSRFLAAHMLADQRPSPMAHPNPNRTAIPFPDYLSEMLRTQSFLAFPRFLHGRTWRCTGRPVQAFPRSNPARLSPEYCPRTYAACYESYSARPKLVVGVGKRADREPSQTGEPWEITRQRPVAAQERPPCSVLHVFSLLSDAQINSPKCPRHEHG